MTDFNLIDRISALKLEFESSTDNPVTIFKSIFNVLKNRDGHQPDDIKKILRKYIRLYPCEGVDNRLISKIARDAVTSHQFSSFQTFPDFFPMTNTIFSPHTMRFNLSNLFRVQEEEESSVPLLLKEEELEKLKTDKYVNVKEDGSLDKACIFTQGEFTDNDKVTILPCNHIFSHEEIKKWLTMTSYKCPICRESAGDHYAKLN